jgi:hypothetical protein
MNEVYLPPVEGSVWSISRLVEGRWIKLTQDRLLERPGDGVAILRALCIPVTGENLDTYFPKYPMYGRCPTLALLELCNVLDPTNPLFLKQKGEVGV